MSKSKEKKKNQLGEDAGTASNRLKKSIMFHYIKKAGDNYCYQCGSEIVDIEELSIEHKIPWLDSDNPSEMFYDLDNIAFSHLSCNCSAARKRQSEHGSQSKYKAGCRCDECKRGNRDKMRKQRAKKAV